MKFCLNMFEQCRDMMRSALGSFHLLGALAFRDKLGFHMFAMPSARMDMKRCLTSDSDAATELIRAHRHKQMQTN